MIAAHEMMCSIQAWQYLVDCLSVETEVSQVPHNIVGSNRRVVADDHLFHHVIDGLKWTVAILDDVLVIVVLIRSKEYCHQSDDKPSFTHIELAKKFFF
jgi:hypothetical protein